MKHISFTTKLFITVAGLFLSFVVCFIFFQYQREKTYRINLLDTKLQDINADVHGLYLSGLPVEQYGDRILRDSIRITVTDLSGTVLYDSRASVTEYIENHSDRTEIREALQHGHGHDIKRESSTVGGKWFYSATAFPEDNLIIRSAHVYDVPMTDMLASDKRFLWIALALSIMLIAIYYLYIRRIHINISNLREFAGMAEKNQDIVNAEIRFTDDELGEISGDIVKLYARLQNSEDDKTRLKRQLTQNIAHELKTPVSSICGYLETIIDNPGMPEETRNDFLQRCYAQSRRLGNLISDITLLSKIEEASSGFSMEDIDMAEMLNSIRKDMEPQLSARKMKFLVLISPGTMVNGNQMLIYSIFRNLTDNSIAYAGENTVITVQCLKEDRLHCHFSFADNGAGVSQEHLPHLFERFYRVDKGRSRKSGGTGLGLAIVKNAVLLHGGQISVRVSRAGGLEFLFTLPKGTKKGKA